MFHDGNKQPEQGDKESDEKQNAHIQQQLQVANRTASEATHRSEIKEAQESHEREERSRRKAEQCKDELSILRQRYQGMESDLKMSKLRNECMVDRTKIGAMETMIKEIQTDPNKNRPSKVDAKIRMPKLELQRLRAKHESQRQLLENLEEMGSMIEAMQRAASTGDEITVKRLLSRGVDVNIPDDSGYTAFMYCCGQGHLRIAELMITVGGANADDSLDSKTSPLIMATSKSHACVIKLLLEHGASVDQRDELHRTPLLIACEKGCNECVDILLAAQANPNAFDKRGNTGLHHAAGSGNESIVQILIAHGVNSSLKNNNMMTALAIARSRRHFNVVDTIAKK